jgi:hypothetical protein
MIITFCVDELSSGGISRKGFLLLNPGDVAAGAAIFVGLVGNAARTGVVALLLPEEFLTRNGFVSEFEADELGSRRLGLGSSKGDINAIHTPVSAIKALLRVKGL